MGLAPARATYESIVGPVRAIAQATHGARADGSGKLPLWSFT